MEWKFVESQEDGDIWLRASSELHAMIDFVARDGREWRIMVVTKTWLDKQLASVQVDSKRRGRAIFPAMLVIADGRPEELVDSIQAAVDLGGLEHFASAID